MSLLKVRNKNGVDRTFALTQTDTVESIRKRIQKELELPRNIKIHFPGRDPKPRDQDVVLGHFPQGVTIDVSESEDDGEDTEDDGLKNDFTIGMYHLISYNQAGENATQFNGVVGMSEARKDRATRAIITKNRAEQLAFQSNAILDPESFKHLLEAMKPRM
ncbi:hypothetical protein O1611_g3131 [Lasiodiplodia mahajangana]|uniref:Uncharacterized protein n=1 Tax=Lasiodiplodia mahajangana TaxID=1108764 RepID=A0ACC2JTB5_9PEZI|nr:hypothetical protein O1611_g3131 [Lasiodiplodia mahajangana]